MSSAPRIIVNAVERVVHDDAHEWLLGWLRDDLGLTGTKYGCGERACGACSVLIDGALARACVVSTSDAVGRSVTTIEGLSSDENRHPVQQAFVDADAMQCGFCTPGMVVAAVALLAVRSDPTDEQIARWMAPNICRCCAYPRIMEAIRRAAQLTETASPLPIEPTLDPAIQGRPRAPWDLVDAGDRDYFDVLGDGLVQIAAPRPPEPGVWALTGGAWIHVSVAGAITAFTGKVEVGQGTRRALRGIVADELGVALGGVRLVMGDTDVCPFDVGTFGSLSMPTAATELRRAAAAARRTLGRIGELAPGVRRVEIAGPDDNVATPGESRGARDTVGPGDSMAVTGAKRFVSDLDRPGMRHGKVLRPPRLGARLRSVDVSRARAMPDVTVVVDGQLVCIAAPTQVVASAAIDAIDAEWDLGDTIAEVDLESHLRAHQVTSEGRGGAYAHDVGDFEGGFEASVVQVACTYTTAYIAHAPIETRVALAEWVDGRVTVWAATQQPFGVRRALAAALEVEEHRVRVIVPDSGTGFGGKHDPDVAIAAALLARAAGAPVKLQWSREEEFTWAYFRPAAVIDVRAGATSDGAIAAWEFININAGNAAIRAPYEIANQRLRYQPAESPLRQGSYRALAATANNFARESAIDELAHALRVDPLQLRLHHLRDDERLTAVLRAAADRFGWDEAPRDIGYGIGLAAGLEKGGRVTTCALVQVDGDQLDILRVVTAFECGAIVDPDNLRKQIEGATIMGLGGALFEAIHFDAGQILNPTFTRYRVPRMTDAPPVEVVLLDRPDLASAGAGETPIITIAPALANAIFDATGRRIRSLPLLEHSDLRTRDVPS